ncbi:MAG: regulatory protein RecX [Thioploca sp.]|nr:regulatory protein RecX [Thioploca sp.]
MTNKLYQQVQACAKAYLAQREHSRLELHHKLIKKGFDSTVIATVLTQLQTDNLLSDERFVENYLRTRINKGYGPLRIEQELRERGIASGLLNQTLNCHDPQWIVRAQQAWQKRFGQNLSPDRREQAKQIRFLQYRGFTSSQIKAVLSGSVSEES